MKSKLQYFFILLLLISLSFAEQLSCSSNATHYILNFEDNRLLLPGILAFTVFMIILAYMIGKTTNNPQFQIFYKDEMFHLFFSLAILVVFSGILFFSCEAMRLFFDFYVQKAGIISPHYTSGKSLLDIAYDMIFYMSSDASYFSGHLIKKTIDATMSSTWGYSLYFPFYGGLTIATNAYKRTHALQYDSLNTFFILPALISINVQKLLLKFVIDYGEVYLLPLGFFLRLFPSMRQMGNIVIAFALGLFTILPFMYVLNGLMYDVVTPPPPQGCDQSMKNIIDDHVVGDCGKNSFYTAARLLPQAFFLPNLTLAIFITYLAAINKALRVLG